MKSYIVIGLGRFGGSLARQLCTLGAEVLAMDVHNDLVQQLANDVTHAVVGDARDKEVLLHGLRRIPLKIRLLPGRRRGGDHRPLHRRRVF